MNRLTRHGGFIVGATLLYMNAALFWGAVVEVLILEIEVPTLFRNPLSGEFPVSILRCWGVAAAIFWLPGLGYGIVMSLLSAVLPWRRCAILGVAATLLGMVFPASLQLMSEPLPFLEYASPADLQQPVFIAALLGCPVSALVVEAVLRKLGLVDRTGLRSKVSPA